jgi:hypothetical protein
VAPPSNLNKLYPSTTVMQTQLSSIRSLISEVLALLHCSTGRNFPKFDSFFLPDQNIPVLPYAEIAQDDPAIAAMQQAIEKTVIASMAAAAAEVAVRRDLGGGDGTSRGGGERRLTSEGGEGTTLAAGASPR